MVQDLVQDQLASAQPAELKGRVSFEQHDVFTPQPVQDAALYLCRAIDHKYSDTDAARMLQALIPALENRDDDPHILNNDGMLPEQAAEPDNATSNHTITRTEANRVCQMDLLMLGLCGTRERTRKDFEHLLRTVDPRLEIVRVQYNPRGAELVEIRLNDEKMPTTSTELPGNSRRALDVETRVVDPR